MKMNPVRLTLLLVILAFFGIASNAAAAYHLQYMYVQHRVYADGTTFDRFWCDFRDANGNYPQDDILESITLYDPAGNVIIDDKSDVSFWKTPQFYIGYDSVNGRWNYGEQPFWESGYSTSNIPVPLIGTYRLVATDIYGESSEVTYQFNGEVDLPFLKGMKYMLDGYGNFIWEWRVPFYYDASLSTSSRAFLDIYQGKTMVAELTAIVPTHMGRVFIPKDIMDVVRSSGDRFKLTLQLRTNDNNNRTYSTTVTARIPALPAAQLLFETAGDEVMPLPGEGGQQ